ncbi:hypothetical protein K1719_002205 [Acacia pycnantha]|nr:hypothetical protein K1719_002205 [Acacia pycnantha]
MGSIYEAMDRAKEKIEDGFKKKPSFYQPIWDVIDARWEKQLHRPLHAAGYYLNPKQHYSPTFKVDYEVKVPLGVSGIGVLLRWSTQRKEIV